MNRPPYLLLLAMAAAAVAVSSAACGSSDSAGSSSGVDPGTEGGVLDPDGGSVLPDGGSNPNPDGSTPKPDGSVTTGAIKTVFLIMLENHSWATLQGAGASATYINGTLVPMGAHAEAYSTPPGNHPSEPNYVWLEAGDALGITTDNPPSANHQATTDHLSSQLEAKNISWKAYAEDAPAGTCPLTATGLFDPKHTPQLYFDDVTDTNMASSAHCQAHIKPFSTFEADLTANTVARYNFITPNLCNDMHGNGFSGACSVLGSDDGHIKLGDDWLAAEVPKILASAAYKDNGVIFILWDEGDELTPPLPAKDGPIGMIVISPLAKTNFSTSTAFTHSSTLRTMEEIFGVPLLRDAKNAKSLGEMFTAYP
jgi:hypothetical protein